MFISVREKVAIPLIKMPLQTNSDMNLSECGREGQDKSFMRAKSNGVSSVLRHATTVPNRVLIIMKL